MSSSHDALHESRASPGIHGDSTQILFSSSGLCCGGLDYDLKHVSVFSCFVAPDGDVTRRSDRFSAVTFVLCLKAESGQNLSGFQLEHQQLRGLQTWWKPNVHFCPTVFSMTRSGHFLSAFCRQKETQTKFWSLQVPVFQPRSFGTLFFGFGCTLA